MSKAAPGVQFTAFIARQGPGAYFDLPFDPKEKLGTLRAPVKVTINGFTFRTTVTTMGGRPWIGLRASNREAARVDEGDRVPVRVELDTEPRTVRPPADLVKALKAAPQAWDRWHELSFTHQREHAEAIEGAKKPETRERRIAAAVAALENVKARPAKKR